MIDVERNGLSSAEFTRRCNADGEFRLAARYWNGGLRLRLGDGAEGVTVAAAVLDGVMVDRDPDGDVGVITLTADRAVWDAMLREVPPPGYNDISPAQRLGLRREGDELLYWQYLPAVQRAVELLRAPASPDTASSPESAATPDTGTVPETRAIPAPGERAERAGSRSAVSTDRPPSATPARFDSPVGRYVHLQIDGVDHRVYFEEAGSGIPMLLQHTAGSHGVQWRHLFECAAITDHFRLIAYDLPFHGKSVPPVGPRWWAEPYRLTGAFLRAVPVGLAGALGLDRPAFMGCSVGGLLALDLALHHPEVFRAVISVEGALRIGGDLESLIGFWHPAVSNETKARMMEGLTSPTSPLPYRKETTQAYAAGWPPAFLGDLHYYAVDYDLRERAGEIDTERVAVHLLTGEYDYSATPTHGRTAQEAIAGSTFTEMAGLGHFPMSEDPERFIGHLLPVLDAVRALSG